MQQMCGIYYNTSEAICYSHTEHLYLVRNYIFPSYVSGDFLLRNWLVIPPNLRIHFSWCKDHILQLLLNCWVILRKSLRLFSWAYPARKPVLDLQLPLHASWDGCWSPRRHFRRGKGYTDCGCINVAKNFYHSSCQDVSVLNHVVDVKNLE